MNLLFLHQNFPAQFKHLAPALAQRGHDVKALTLRPEAPAAWQGVGMDIRACHHYRTHWVAGTGAERGPGGPRAWTAAPAYAPIEGLEVGAAVSRDTTERSTALRLQGKLQSTRPTEDACGHAAVLGIAHERPKAVNARWFNLVMSCPVAPGNVHLNLGATQTARKSAKAFIGAAWEQDLGWASGHVEWIAAQSAQPIVNLGLRREIAKGLQLDGSVGRQAGRTLFSVGLKQQF